MTAGLLAACGGGGNSGGSSGGNQPAPGPKPCATCKHIDRDLSKLSAQTLSDIHGALLSEQARSGLNPADWRKLSGWKLFKITGKYVNVDETTLDDAKNARLFFTLHQALHTSDGQVKSSIDTDAILAELIREYFK